MRPLVSVIIATYNRSNVLPYSIGSILNQTLSDFEVLVIGDGCTDDSEAVVTGINDPRVRWFNLPENSGHQSIPNNEGLRLAQGKYIAYLGHDDLWLPHHLETLAEKLEAGAGLAFGLVLLIGSQQRERQILPLKAEYSANMWLPPTGLAHAKSVTDAVGGWRHYREIVRHPEVELCSRALEADYKFECSMRLTALKFPAAARKDVYKTRDCHEQAAWFTRIREEENFERTELVETLLAATRTVERALEPKPYRHMLRELGRETRRRFLYRLNPERSRQADSIDAMRQYKGLDRKP